LAERVRYFKEDAKGVTDMCKVVEELALEIAEEEIGKNRKESALKLIGTGKLTLEEVADSISLPIDEVKALVNGA
jgi:hypothetical protein